MANLSQTEKRWFERLLGMHTGYVSNFSNRTFSEFITDSTGRNIDDETRYGRGSKATRLREFWKVESNRIVGKLMADMLHYVETEGLFIDQPPTIIQECKRVASR